MAEIETFPRGWFVVAWADELAPGQVKPLHYFDRHMVMFRTEAGQVSVLDAHCPHLGAHLGHGGKVVGDRVVCPFHAWEFGTSGRCEHIPYASKVPPKAALAPWHVHEANGVIFVWFDPAGGPPTWDVPTIDVVGSPDWTPWFPNVLQVKTHPREIVENVADSAHFPVVHRTNVERFENIYDGHKATQITQGVATPPQGGIDHFLIEATYHGPAFQISDMKGYLHSVLLLAHTPITANLLDLRFAVMLERKGPRTEEFAKFYVENLRLGFHEDIDIWEHKLYRERPQIVKGDGPIGRLRQWYRQFYEPEALAAK